MVQFMNPVEVFVTDSVEQIKTDCFQEHADKNLPDHSEEGGYFGWEAQLRTRAVEVEQSWGDETQIHKVNKQGFIP